MIPIQLLNGLYSETSILYDIKHCKLDEDDEKIIQCIFLVRCANVMNADCFLIITLFSDDVSFLALVFYELYDLNIFHCELRQMSPIAGLILVSFFIIQSLLGYLIFDLN